MIRRMQICWIREQLHVCDQGYPVGAINLAGQTPIILVNDGPSMGGFIVPYTVPSASFWKLGQAKPGDSFNFVEISVEKAQTLRSEQTIICSEESLVSHNKQDILIRKKQINKIDHIKVIDFDKEKLDEKIRNKMIEKKGMKNIKVRFFN